MAAGLGQTQAEASGVLREATKSGLAGLRDLARTADALADQLGGDLDRLQTLLSMPVPEPSPPPKPREDLTGPLLLDFAQRSALLASRQDIPALLASSAARLAPRVLLFARRGAELVGWDCFVGGQSHSPDLRGARLDLADLRDLSETLDEGLHFSYAGFLQPFYMQLPGPFSAEVAQSCFIPLRVARQCIGVLCADSPTGDASIEELPLRLLALQAGLQMELMVRSAEPSEAAEAAAPFSRTPKAKAPPVVVAAPKPSDFLPPVLPEPSVAIPAEAHAAPASAGSAAPAAVPVPSPDLASDVPVLVESSLALAASPEAPPTAPPQINVLPPRKSAVLESPPSTPTPVIALPPLKPAVLEAPPSTPPPVIALPPLDLAVLEAPSPVPPPVIVLPPPAPAVSVPSSPVPPPVIDLMPESAFLAGTVDAPPAVIALPPLETSQPAPSTAAASVAVPAPDWFVDFDAEPLPAVAPSAAVPGVVDSSGDGEMIWDIDDAFGGATATSSEDEGFTGFHVDSPDEDETVAKLLAQSAPRDETEDERTARKLARVVVQDVMLYNTKKIAQGFKTGNLGDPLSDDIFRGAAHYKLKVAPSLYPKRYFWDALVDLLAKGRPELLSTLKIDF